ncbi:hypothetical protein [Streptomyces rimosus]
MRLILVGQHTHINFLGRYLFNITAGGPGQDLRPLRDPDAVEGTAKTRSDGRRTRPVGPCVVEAEVPRRYPGPVREEDTMARTKVRPLGRCTRW